MNDATQPASQSSGYRVLARKYRPATFSDLIGQDAMVRTISNAFEAGRIPQAWILTGVRGVGKTTTARILARGLNYQLADGSITGPTVTMPGLGVHCQPIMESRHLDVIEMDAASHNGVDDIRQINDAVRYAPVEARYKVYILDEVHMLTPQAFNALLKTLEEPPPHAKFIFATTDIRKVPVTVLSRCQRFDLRRVEAQVLVRHLQGIADTEKVAVEPDALALIARAAEGSVRDALSLFDQAIAHAGGDIRGEDVRQMLGLADRTRTIALFEAVMRGDAAAALAELREQYNIGADPAVALSDLAEFTHFVTRVKVVPSVADDVSFAESERVRGRALAEKLSMRVLSRAWQMLLKGVTETEESGRPLAAAEMVLIRLAYAADLPTPDEVIRSLDSNGNGNGSGSGNAPAPRAAYGASAGPAASAALAPRFGSPRNDMPRNDMPRGSPRAALAAQPIGDPTALAPSEAAAAPMVIDSFEGLIALATQKRDLSVKAALEHDLRLVRCEEGRLDVALEPSAAQGLMLDLARKFTQWTGRRWVVVSSSEPAQPTIKSQRETRQAELKSGVQADPLVQAVMARFPGAEIVQVRPAEQAADMPLVDPDDVSAEDLPPEPRPGDDGSYDGD
jgi:DNA polymerase III subunit gamma/tau